MRSAYGKPLPFLLPFAVGFCLLTLLPAIASLLLSFTRTDGLIAISEAEWVGLDNYTEAIGIDKTHTPTTRDPWYWSYLGGKPNDRRFYQSLYNSSVYTIFSVPLSLLASLMVAVFLSRRKPGMSVVRTIVYLPHILGGVATIMIWSFLFNPRFGWVNAMIVGTYDLLDPVVALFASGGTSDWPVPDWLYSPYWCKPAVIIMSMWTMGGSMLIFLAAMHRIPSQTNEAAMLDGAGRIAKFWHVTLPQLTPAILFNVLFAFLFSMQAFNESYLLENRAQRDGLLFYVRHLFETAFEAPYRIGYACALAWILFAVLLVVIVPLLLSARRWVYDALVDESN